ncbi:hypothetical protein E2C01_011820 [Portunus trituberculatus]|uniref:Uncharacterized protein n=1 Tax=Portunus trituberculatus TaxID=210409 RepID=A0A5B7DC90_PORTR|nr:hypothetical protein [Portunus trituberculatus]
MQQEMDLELVIGLEFSYTKKTKALYILYLRGAFSSVSCEAVTFNAWSVSVTKQGIFHARNIWSVEVYGV